MIYESSYNFPDHNFLLDIPKNFLNFIDVNFLKIFSLFPKCDVIFLVIYLLNIHLPHRLHHRQRSPCQPLHNPSRGRPNPHEPR